MRGTSDQNSGLCSRERFNKPRRRENIERTGGSADREPELQRIKAIEVRVGRKAQNAIVRPKAELGRA